MLTGKERLKVCHDILRMDTPEPFLFRWEDFPRSGLSTKDYIAPSSFYFGRARDFRMGRKFATVSFLQILAPELSDRVLKDFLDMDSSEIVTMHIQSVDQNKAIKQIKHTITELDRSKISKQWQPQVGNALSCCNFYNDSIPPQFAFLTSQMKKELIFMDFTKDEEILMMLYSPGTRLGLIAALKEMSAKLDLKNPEDSHLYRLTASVLQKLASLSDADFERIDLYRNL